VLFKDPESGKPLVKDLTEDILANVAGDLVAGPLTRHHGGAAAPAVRHHYPQVW
jgi:hypothetical protein